MAKMQYQRFEPRGDHLQCSREGMMIRDPNGLGASVRDWGIQAEGLESIFHHWDAGQHGIVLAALVSWLSYPNGNFDVC